MAKQIKFLRNHLTHKYDELVSVGESRANYLIKCGIAIEVKVDEIEAPVVPESITKKTRKKK